MTDLITKTLVHWRQGSFAWGQSDCLLSIGDYLAQAGHLNVSERFRGTYSTEGGAFAHLDSHGGHVGMIDLVGLPVTSEPKRGDVAVLDLGENEIGALCTGHSYAMRIERGVIEVPVRLARVVCAWKV